jgi:hypothetical protein
MTRRNPPRSNARSQEISTELSSLFQQQFELTRREAFVGLTPEEREQFDKIAESIRDSCIELARIEAEL